MGIWIMMLPCIGLALDDFILMMGKGATLKDLTTEKTMAYAGIFGSVNLAAALIGCGLYYRRMAYRLFGGVTGDLAGWLLQMTELALIAVVIMGGKLV